MKLHCATNYSNKYDKTNISKQKWHMFHKNKVGWITKAQFYIPWKESREAQFSMPWTEMEQDCNIYQTLKFLNSIQYPHSVSGNIIAEELLCRQCIEWFHRFHSAQHNCIKSTIALL